MPLFPGTRLGRYEIAGLLGAGGMGEVYRATDTKLGREVAIKVLPSGTLLDEQARRRFRNEARSLSRLNHPNIATIHDFDSEEGVDFLVMEHITGRTLDARVASGALPESEVIAIGSQIAAGLAAAHAEGVIHRDLKPGNLRLTADGRVKILDFGLARLLVPPGGTSRAETVSRTDATAGTVPYMAPEQLRAGQVAAQTDLFALGAVLYELATGRRAFGGETAGQVVAAILDRPPASVRSLNPAVSPELERIILKCLEKDPALRYQSAVEVGVDLRRLGAPGGGPAPAPARTPIVSHRRRLWLAAAAGAAMTVALITLNAGGVRDRLFHGGGPGRIDSLAVLPLENLSPDPGQEYFADGVTEELISSLAGIRALKVISRTSIMSYKGTRKPLPEIARELGVDAIVEGTVRRAGDRVRVTAQLIRAETDQHLWTGTYERHLRNILDLQSEVARVIAREIKIELTPQESERLARNGPVNPEAYEAYLLGRHLWNRRSGEGVRRAIEQFERAIDRDGTYAPAYAGLADAYFIGSLEGDIPPQEAYPKARHAALEALRLDDRLGEAHVSLAAVHTWFERDWPAAEAEYRRAIELNGSYALAHHWYAILLWYRGRDSEALDRIEQARSLDPLSLIIRTNVALIAYYAKRDYARALEEWREVLALDPGFIRARDHLGLVYAQMGRYDEAVAELGRYRELGGNEVWYLETLGIVDVLSGKTAEARKVLETMVELSKRRYVSPSLLSLLCGLLGERDQAFSLLEEAYRLRDPWLVESMVEARMVPGYDTRRSDPRFSDMLRRLDLPPQ